MSTNTKEIYILRHGQAMHNVDRVYPHLDPPLTTQGEVEVSKVTLPSNWQPDLIISSPMLRTLQTMTIIHASSNLSKTPIKIWPDLREAWGGTCNTGMSRSEISAAYPHLDFSLCMEEWDYEPHSDVTAEERADRLLKALLARPEKKILLVSHRNIIWFLVGGVQFTNCELRAYCFNDSGRLIPLESSSNEVVPT